MSCGCGDVVVSKKNHGSILCPKPMKEKVRFENQEFCITKTYPCGGGDIAGRPAGSIAYEATAPFPFGTVKVLNAGQCPMSFGIFDAAGNLTRVNNIAPGSEAAITSNEIFQVVFGCDGTGNCTATLTFSIFLPVPSTD